MRLYTIGITCAHGSAGHPSGRAVAIVLRPAAHARGASMKARECRKEYSHIIARLVPPLPFAVLLCACVRLCMPVCVCVCLYVCVSRVIFQN